MDSPDARLARLGDRQHGLATRDQARELGFTYAMLRTRLSSGRLEAFGPRVLRIGGSARTWRQRLLMVCWAADGVASHRAAAALHGFDGFRGRPMEVTIARARNYRSKGVVVHSTCLPTRDRMKIELIPVTTPARTLVDLAAVVPRHRLDDAFDSAERDRKVTRQQVEAVLEAIRGSGRNGVGLMAAFLEQRGRRKQPRSRLERTMLRLLEGNGLPRPECQYRVVRRDGQVADLDFAYPDLKIGIEIDSQVGHATRRQRVNDAHRQNDIVIDDWLIVRFDYEDVVSAPDYVAETIGRALARSRDNNGALSTRSVAKGRRSG